MSPSLLRDRQTPRPPRARRRPSLPHPHVAPWLVRAVVLLPVQVVANVGVDLAAARWPEQGGWLRLGTLVALVLLTLVWGIWDGTRDARARDDVPARWLKAGLAVGPVAAFLGWLVRTLAVDATGLESLWGQLTGGASFTALLVLVPAVTGVVLGRWLVATPGEGRPGPLQRRRDRRQSSTAPVAGGASRATAE